MNHKLFSTAVTTGVICHIVAMFIHTFKGDNVRNPIGVEP